MSIRRSLVALAVGMAAFSMAQDAQARGRGPGGGGCPRSGGAPGMNSMAGSPYASQLQSSIQQNAMRSGMAQQAMLQQTMLQNAILQQMYLQAAQNRWNPGVNNAQLAGNVLLK